MFSSVKSCFLRVLHSVGSGGFSSVTRTEQEADFRSGSVVVSQFGLVILLNVLSHANPQRMHPAAADKRWKLKLQFDRRTHRHARVWLHAPLQNIPLCFHAIHIHFNCFSITRAFLPHENTNLQILTEIQKQNAATLSHLYPFCRSLICCSVQLQFFFHSTRRINLLSIWMRLCFNISAFTHNSSLIILLCTPRGWNKKMGVGKKKQKTGCENEKYITEKDWKTKNLKNFWGLKIKRN